MQPCGPASEGRRPAHPVDDRDDATGCSLASSPDHAASAKSATVVFAVVVSMRLSEVVKHGTHLGRLSG